MFFTSDDTGTAKERGMNGNRQRITPARSTATGDRSGLNVPAPRRPRADEEELGSNEQAECLA
jgi:hypothetical protein